MAMAHALALLHWTAKADANDVEFVLVRPRPRGQSMPPGPNSGNGRCDFTHGVFGPYSMWILDFDCCQELSMDEDGINRATRCFWRNDPFYPRPGSESCKDDQLWQVFRTRFIISSQLILREEGTCILELPERLMDRICEIRGCEA